MRAASSPGGHHKAPKEATSPPRSINSESLRALLCMPLESWKRCVIRPAPGSHSDKIMICHARDLKPVDLRVRSCCRFPTLELHVRA